MAVLGGVPAPLIADGIDEHQPAAMLGIIGDAHRDRGLRAGIPDENQDLRLVAEQP